MAKEKDTSFDDFQITETTSFRQPGSYVPEPEAEEKEAEEAEEVEETEEETTQETENTEEETTAEETKDTAEEVFTYAPLAEDLEAEGILTLPEGKAFEDYEDSAEGFRAMVKDSVSTQLEVAIGKLPDTAQRLMQLALNGATEEDVQSFLALTDAPDWEAADLEDEDVQKAVVEEAMRLREPDLTDEEVAERIQDLEDLNKLAKQGEKDKKFLMKVQADEQKKLEAHIASQKLEVQKANEAEIQKAKDYITSQETIAGKKLDKKTREDFFAYLTVKDKQGKTKAEYNNTYERRMQKEFLNYLNFDLGKLERDTTTEVVKNVKKQLVRYNNTGATRSASQPVVVEKEVEGALGKLALPSQYSQFLKK